LLETLLLVETKALALMLTDTALDLLLTETALDLLLTETRAPKREVSIQSHDINSGRGANSVNAGHPIEQRARAA
jgi:hypothetical protein